MKVSVIIPVYNAEEYLQETINSVISLSETGEVILVEDGSKDDSFRLCEKLANKHKKIKLFTHEKRQNKGASASRNLGIKNATCNYISFLDSDDLYLPHRFVKAKELFNKYPHIDGVYEAIGKFFEDKKAEEIRGKNKLKLTTLTKKVKPEDLFESLLIKNVGHIHTSGITVKKTIFAKTGFFDENLMISEDTAMWFKMAAVAKLISGDLIKPVSMQRLRSESLSSSTEKVRNSMPLLWKTLWHWGYQNNLDSRKLDLLFYRHVDDYLQLVKNQNIIKRKIYTIQLMTKLFFQYPKIVRNQSFWLYINSLLGLSKLALNN